MTVRETLEQRLAERRLGRTGWRALRCARHFEAVTGTRYSDALLTVALMNELARDAMQAFMRAPQTRAMLRIAEVFSAATSTRPR